MYLQATLSTAKDVESVAVEKRRHDDSVIVSTLYPLTATLPQRIKACKCLGVAASYITQIDLGRIKTQRINITPTFHPDTQKYMVRSILDKSVERAEFATFKSALEASGVGSDYVIEWEGIDNACCLDIDFDTAPPQHQLIAAAQDLRFCPWFLMGSKSKSVHLIYRGADVYSAVEFAAAGMMELAQRYPHAKYEFLSRTRASFIDPMELTQPKDLDGMRALLQEREGTEAEFSDWLKDRNMKPGGRYPHSKCPVRPDNAAKGNDPVQVHKHGIKCHKCGADGAKYGSHDAGWFPSRALMGGRLKPGELMLLACNFVHFDQARPELERFAVNEEVQRALYSAVLKSVHEPDDPRIAMVWHPTGRKKLLRKSGYWCDENNDTVDTSADAGLLECLPSVMDLEPDYTAKPNKTKLAWHKQACDISVYGVSPFRAITGYQFSRFDDSQTRVLRAVPYYLRDMVPKQPEYVPESKRLSLESCNEVMDKMFPGINLPLLTLYLIGRGCSEYLSGRLAMLAVTGPSGAGKSLHGIIAAALSGDDPQWYSDQPDMMKFYDAVFRNSQQSGYFFADEIFKNYQTGNTGIITALLQLGPNTAFHMLYHGQARLNCAPFFVATETTIPLAVRQNEQIGRRFVHAHLARVWRIDEHLHAHGLSDVNHVRLSASEEQLAAFNGLLSWVTDMYFPDGKADFFTAAKQLGFGLLKEGDAVEDKHSLIRELVTLVRKSPKASGAEGKRFGSGFATARIGSTEDLWQTFTALQTEQDKRKGEVECNALDETDISAVCGLKAPHRIIVKKHGRNIAFKLQQDG